MHRFILTKSAVQQLQQAAVPQSCRDFFPKGSSFREDLPAEGTMSVLWDYVSLSHRLVDLPVLPCPPNPSEKVTRESNLVPGLRGPQRILT